MMHSTIVVATIIYGIMLLPSIVVAPFAAFLYDDPNAGGIVLHVFAILWFSFAATIIASILGSWVAYVRNKEKVTSIFLLLPILQAAFIAIFGLLHFAS